MTATLVAAARVWAVRGRDGFRTAMATKTVANTHESRRDVFTVVMVVQPAASRRLELVGARCRIGVLAPQRGLRLGVLSGAHERFETRQRFARRDPATVVDTAAPASADTADRQQDQDETHDNDDSENGDSHGRLLHRPRSGALA